jgi:DNA-directed RNA polymerase subunit RPC12/RpoP
LPRFSVWEELKMPPRFCYLLPVDKKAGECYTDTMETKRFTMIDEGFDCAVCGEAVPPLGKSARDHCPKCLCSLHLDVFPGDRAADCGGVLRPVGIRTGKKGIQIVYNCDRCKAERVNIAAPDDDYDLICALSVNKA